jgi:hypothetical protein
VLAAVGHIARLPALHFLVLGGVLAALQSATRAPDEARGRDPIVISAARVAEIRDDYAQSLAPPTPEELRALVARAADEEMLYREALVLGLDRGDGAVRWRIIEKMHFLYGDAAGDPETAYRRGIALGLDEDDVVVRNALVTKMRLLAKAASKQDEPTGEALDRELLAFMTRHPDPYRRADAVTLTHVFLNATTRGARLDADARALLARLRAERIAPDAAARLGDPFVAGATVRAVSRTGLAKTFGDEFAVAALAQPADAWSEPIRSPYGLHLVWVNGRSPGDLPPLGAVRSRVLRAWRAERREQYLGRMMDELRAAYVVRVEDEHAG